MLSIDERLRAMRKEKLIICPYCKYEHDPDVDPETIIDLITYHGEEEPKEFQCLSCRKEFFVKENVRRTFEVKKMMKEFDL